VIPERIILSVMAALAAVAAIAADVHYLNASASGMGLVIILFFAALRWIWRR
jgi:hypothetical protein